MNYMKYIAIILFLLIGGYAKAYKVFPSTGHECKDQLLNKDSYDYVLKHADGMWLMPWNIRSGYLNENEFIQIIKGFDAQEIVVEINDTHVNPDSDSPHPVQLETALNSGATVNTIMAYNEGMNGSILTPENIEMFKKVYGNTYNIVSNIRRWSDETSPAVFSQLDGISFEFQVPEKVPGIWEGVAKAVKWAYDNDKYVFLLTPPGHNNYDVNDGYLNGYIDLFNFLREKVGDKVLMSDKVIFAPANYNIHKTGIQMTPETVIRDGEETWANTVTGVAKWLLEQPLYTSEKATF